MDTLTAPRKNKRQKQIMLDPDVIDATAAAADAKRMSFSAYVNGILAEAHHLGAKEGAATPLTQVPRPGRGKK